MRGWEKWLVKNKQVPAKFLPEVELPEWKAPREQQVSDRECVALIEACALIKDDYDRAMYTALLYVLLTTCLRHDEIINLKIDDISLDEYWIEVQKGKGTSTGGSRCAINAWRRCARTWSCGFAIAVMIGSLRAARCGAWVMTACTTFSNE